MNNTKANARAVAMLLILTTLFMAVPMGALRVEAASPAPAVPTVAVTGLTLGAVAAIFTISVNLAKGFTAFRSASESYNNNDSLSTIVNTAIYSFGGKVYDPDNPGGTSKPLYYEDYMNTVRELKNELLSEFDKLNGNIESVSNQLKNLFKEEYINDFLLTYNGGYVNLATKMIGEYRELSDGFAQGFSTADELKNAYNELYAAAVSLENHLYYFMTDGLFVEGSKTTIQDLFYNASGEGSYEYVRSLYENYLLSLYFIQLCSVYQMNYCVDKNQTQYVVAANDSFFATSIPGKMLNYENNYRKVTSKLAKFYSNAPTVLNVNVSGTDVYTAVPVSSAIEIARNDIVHLPSLSSVTGGLFDTYKMYYEVSNSALAEVSPNGLLKVVGSSGSFSVSVRYDSTLSDFDNVCYKLNFTVKPSAFSGGLGTEAHPYLITTADQFKTVFSNAAYNSKHFFLGADIDLNGSSVDTLNTFTGVIDGNGHRVYDFNAVNLINENNGVIKNLILGHPEQDTNISKVYNEPSEKVETTRIIGILAVSNKGTITNCTVENVTFKVTGTESNNDKTYNVFIGGLVGANYGNISNCLVKSSEISVSISPVEKSGDDISVGAAAVAGLNYEGVIETTVVRYTKVSASAYVWGKGALNKSVPEAWAGGIAVGNYGTVRYCATYGGDCTVSASGEAHVTDASKIMCSIAAVNGGTLQYCYGTGDFADKIAESINGTDSCSSFSSVSAMAQRLNLNGPLYENTSGLPMPDYVKENAVLCGLNSCGVLGEKGFNVAGVTFVMRMKSGNEIGTTHFRLTPTVNSAVGKKTVTVYYGTDSYANLEIDIPCPHGNTFVRPEKMATCLESGYTEGVYCNDCETWIDGNVTRPKLGSHSFGDCSSVSETKHKRVCLICGNAEESEHRWNAGETVQYPTHTATGKVKYTCTDCSYTRTETLPTVEGHSFSGWKNVSATKHARECLCGETEYAAHSWNAGKITLQPTHTKEGNKQYECTDCGATKNESIPTTSAHAFGDWKNYSDGKHVRECPCGETEYADHNWNAGEITVQPTHTREGTKKYTCSGCGANKTETLPMSAAHEFSPWKSYSELLHSRECGCGAVEYDSHKWGEGIPKKPATHTSEGEMMYVCTVCNATRVETVDKLPDHTYVYSVITPATSSQSGMGKYSCACGDSYTVAIPARQITLVSDKAVSKSGNTVSVSVEVSQNCGFSYLRFTLDYDKTALTLVGVKNGVIISDMDHGVNLLWSASSDSTATGTLVTLTFEISPYAEKGDYTVDFISRECFNLKGEDVGVNFRGSSVTLVDYLDGDANGDGAVNGKDVMILRKYFADLDDETGESGVKLYYGADANGDGTVDGRDLILLRWYMADYDDETGRSKIVLGVGASVNAD